MSRQTNYSNIKQNTKINKICRSDYRHKWASPVGQIVEIGQRGEVVHRFCSGSNVTFTYGNSLQHTKSLFLTAGHCLGNECQLNPTTNLQKWRISYDYVEGVQEKLLPIYQVAEHGTCVGGTDFALLEVNGAYTKFGTLPISPLANYQNREVTVVQHPKGLQKYFSRGVVQSYDSNRQEINHTAHTYGGSSGSPVIDHAEEGVIAVHVRGNERVQQNHYAVTVSNIIGQSELLKNIGLFGRQSNRRSLSTNTAQTFMKETKYYYKPEPEPSGICKIL